MNVPQIMMTLLIGMNLGFNLIKHGETEIRTYNFWYALVGACFQVVILKWGGFF